MNLPYIGRHVWTFWFRGHYLQIKWPSAKPLFSERNGYNVPVIKVGGFRVFVGGSSD